MSNRAYLVAAVSVIMPCLAGTAAANRPASSVSPVEDRGGAPHVLARTWRDRGWIIRETDNFRICSRFDAASLSALPELCESWRQRLQSAWFGAAAAERWSPRCEIVVHGSLGEYCRAIGCGNRSVGCTTIRVESGRILSRRVDLRMDAHDWTEAALPHELTHVVLADRFAGRRLPPWADEGMSILAESEHKQAQRRHALRSARSRGTALGLRQLWSVDQPPSAAHRDAFYGQSMELTQYLVDRESPERFLEFVELAMDRGHEAALRQCYDIHGIAALEAECRHGLRYPNENPGMQGTLARRDHRN